MDRLDYYFRQKVTEAELDDGFAKAETGDLNLIIDTDHVGVQTGLVCSQQASPDMTLLLTAGTAYDPLGRRIRVPSNQNVNCAVDYNSVSTSVGGGNERWLSVFVGFVRALTDPRTDGNSLTVYFSRAETFETRVVAGVEAAAAAGVRPSLDSTRILVCDVLISAATTTITNGIISTTRRQDTFVSAVSPVSVIAGTAKGAVLALVTALADHINDTAGAHAATAVSYAGGGTWADASTNPATTVEAQLDKIITDLAGNTGSGKMGTPAVSGTGAGPSISAGRLDTAIGVLHAYVNAGPARMASTTRSSNLVLTTERQVDCDTSGGAFSLTLPAPSNGREIFVKDTKGTFATNALTIIRNGSEKIEGASASAVLQANWGAYRIHSDGTDWYVMGCGSLVNGQSVDEPATSIRAIGNARGKVMSDIASVQTTDATVTSLFTWTIVDEAVTTITVEISAVKSDGSVTASYVRRARVKRDGGTVTVGTVNDVFTDEEAGFATCDVTIDNSSSTGRVRVTGVGATTIDWVAVVTRVEHTHA